MIILKQKKKKQLMFVTSEAALAAVEVWPGGKALVCLSSKNVKVSSVNSLERRIRRNRKAAKWRTEAEVRAACCQWKEEKGDVCHGLMMLLGRHQKKKRKDNTEERASC